MNHPCLVTRLAADGIHQLAICGGASIYQQFLAAGVVNKLYLTVEPILFGSGIRLFNETTVDKKLQLISSRCLNDQGSLWLEYQLKNS
jgi:dihydrofolate reductase